MVRPLIYIETKLVTSPVVVDRVEYGKGTGKTKATAKAAAAKAALECLGWL